MTDLSSLAGNQIELDGLARYAAIVGTQPSKGARSPTLWNAAFAAHGVNAKMLPVDVTSDNLQQLLGVLDNDATFMGGAIAAPYKEHVAQWLGPRLSAPAARIGAVNCLYRGDDGHLAGTNTDGEAALTSFEATNGPVAGKRVLLLGAGGAGKAVAAYFASALERSGQLTICTRSPAAETFARSISAHWVDWSRLDAQLTNVDVIVNCTSVGWGTAVEESPLNAAQLAQLSQTATVFDIVYQPRPTQLLRSAAARGLRTFDGLAMNLAQAVLAFGYAMPGAAPAITQAAMHAAAHSN